MSLLHVLSISCAIDTLLGMSFLWTEREEQRGTVCGKRTFYLFITLLLYVRVLKSQLCPCMRFF